MKIQIIGTGIVGEATAYLSCSLGHEVYGYDIKDRKSQYYHNGLVNDASIVFICVNETALEDSLYDLINSEMNGTYVVRSSTKPGTVDLLSKRYGVHICHNPEFLREKTYLEDAISPHMIILGVCCPQHALILRSFYLPFEQKARIIQTIPHYSEMVKLTINNYLAMLVSFWCQVNSVSRNAGIDADEMAKLVVADPRVSHYGFNPIGVGFSGKCLPKDLRQMIEFSYEKGVTPTLLEAIEKYNNDLRNEDEKAESPLVPNYSIRHSQRCSSRLCITG
jgi:UDPglucose 6-dehydrogenase